MLYKVGAENMGKQDMWPCPETCWLPQLGEGCYWNWWAEAGDVVAQHPPMLAQPVKPLELCSLNVMPRWGNPAPDQQVLLALSPRCLQLWSISTSFVHDVRAS